MRILDVGCGIGQLTRALARAAGASGRVVGIERSAEQIDDGRRRAAGAGDPVRVDIRQGDAYALPLRDDEWGSFDLVHARFLLEHLTDPQRVVDAMVRAARPGGRIVLEDDDHDVLRLYPALPAFEAVWRAYIHTYDASGCDPFVGRRLTAMLAEAGSEPAASDWPFFGACRGASSFDAIVDNCRAIVAGARAAIVARGGMGDSEIDAGIRALQSWRTVPGASFWYCTFWAEAARPR
jgi:SAM-dependent methyltransferase